MSNGRYFTYIQFWRIFYYMTLVVFLNIEIAYFYLKGKKPIGRILHIFTSFLILALARVVEVVIVDVIFGYYLRCIQDILINILIGGWLNYVSLQFGIKKMIGTVYAVASVLWIITNSYHGFYIINYSFESIAYHQYYFFLVAIGTLLSLVYGSVFLLYLQKELTYTKKRGIYLFYAILFPLILYLIRVFGIIPFDWVELHFLALSISVLLISRVLFKYLPSKFQPSFFNDLVDGMTETIIVSDHQGKIMYVNNTKIKSLINRDAIIKNRTIQQIFNRDVTVNLLEIINSNELVRVKNKDKEFYFQCMKERIRKNKQVIGYVFILSDVTHLQNILFHLEEKNKYLSKINKELENYSDIASQLETERECERLMEELRTSLGKSFSKLIKKMERTLLEVEGGSEQGYIYLDEAINVGREHLNTVRKTVNKYRQVKNNE